VVDHSMGREREACFDYTITQGRQTRFWVYQLTNQTKPGIMKPNFEIPNRRSCEPPLGCPMVFRSYSVNSRRQTRIGLRSAI
jgi:hypothetical protein